ncbi:methyltransferase domain-containing protein [Streptomyces phaeochromogenes]|uniref:class I SAM-dependent methyltransferase n=1 Tax=Streptomyces phaeochromogenes TaxID=1923 RepID=UPI0033FDD5D8|nr:methyltransferase domain-containing protein [Streptomyces phaeochromogenes]WSW20000.1 methyltransferase domain-containing protein [Streptomyces phaeochromogenes]WTA02028.1 methyltransferase domain-containing protein [Streptomyces phaeochromogenes]
MTDATIVNTHQAEAWNGYEGTHWAAHQTRYDNLNDAANEPLLAAARIKDTDAVLDIGCGNGRLARLAAGRGARALGVDLSVPMLERARASAAEEGLDNVAFVQGDAQVYPFPEAGFDVALSRFGVMFFADPVAAFANIGRALRPGGRLAFVCPQAFSRMEQSVILAAVAEHVPLPDLSQDTKTGPASFADPERTTGVLRDAGFEDAAAEAVERSQLWGADAEDAATFLFGWGPMRHWLRDADPEATERARLAAVDAFRAYESDTGIRLTARLWLVTATWPGVA